MGVLPDSTPHRVFDGQLVSKRRRLRRAESGAATVFSEDYSYHLPYARRTYFLMGVQPPRLGWRENLIGEGLLTLDDVFHFGVNDASAINATYLFWWFFINEMDPYDFSETVALIKARRATINDTCPESLICNPD
jgi:hypothetical protein